MGTFDKQTGVASAIVENWPVPEATREQLGKLRICEHGTHQIDENDPGLNANGEHATTCPDHQTFNARFALRHADAEITATIIEDLRTGGPISRLIEQDIMRNGPIRRALHLRFA